MEGDEPLERDPVGVAVTVFDRDAEGEGVTDEVGVEVGEPVPVGDTLPPALGVLLEVAEGGGVPLGDAPWVNDEVGENEFVVVGVGVPLGVTVSEGVFVVEGQGVVEGVPVIEGAEEEVTVLVGVGVALAVVEKDSVDVPVPDTVGDVDAVGDGE